MATQPLRAARPRPSLRVITGRRERRALLPAAVVLVLAVFGVAALQAYVGQEGLRMARLERQVEQAKERNALLRRKAAERSSPERVAEAAAEAGLVPATNPTFLPVSGAPVTRDADPGRALDTKRLLARTP